MMIIDGRSCIFGDLFVFDVDDKYAFDIDEDVDVTATYAPDRTQPFTDGWDRKGGDGYGEEKEGEPETGAAVRAATDRIDGAPAGRGFVVETHRAGGV